MWSYSPTDMSAPLNFVRMKIGDTNALDQQLQDEEINCMLLVIPNLKLACSKCALAIAAKLARIHDYNKLGPSLVRDTNLYNHYIDLSKQLATEAKSVSIFAGVMVSPHPSIFNIGMMDDLQLATFESITSNSLDGSLDDIEVATNVDVEVGVTEDNESTIQQQDGN